MAIDEPAVVAKLQAIFSEGLPSEEDGPEVGIGDDAAVVRFGRQHVVSSVDACVEGVHFRRDWLTMRQLGEKSLTAAVSDLAAMGVGLRSALVHVTFPRGASSRQLLAIARGQHAAARRLGGAVHGGNLSGGEAWSIVTTVMGAGAGRLRRVGARVGDEIWLVGEVGLARAGYLLLESGDADSCGISRSRYARRCVRAWRSPMAMIAEGQALVGRATACLDVSDGLAADAPRLATASGVQLEIDAVALESSLDPAVRWGAERASRSAFEESLIGGEDYALLATGPARRRPAFAEVIGRVAEGPVGALVRMPDGKRVPLSGGFDHFRR